MIYQIISYTFVSVYRLNHFVVTLGSRIHPESIAFEQGPVLRTDDFAKCGVWPDEVTEPGLHEMHCRDDAFGRYLYVVGGIEWEYLQICEIEVFGEREYHKFYSFFKARFTKTTQDNRFMNIHIYFSWCCSTIGTW